MSETETASEVIKNIPIEHLREFRGDGLRPVDTGVEEYHGLVASIREKGFMGALTVRLQEDNVTGESFYEIVDGGHRFTAAKECGLSEIPCLITDYSDGEVLEAQLMANHHRVATRPADMSKQLIRIINQNPEINEGILAVRLGVSTAWVEQRLKLNKIVDEGIRELINNGDIILSNAVMLAMLPEEEQGEFLEAALNKPQGEFVPLVKERLSAIRAARRTGDSTTAEKGFQPTAILRKRNEMVEVYENGTIVDLMPNGLDSADTATWVLAWVLNLDEESIERRKAEWEAREAEKQAEAERRKKEREAKKAADAAAKAAMVTG